MTTGASGPIHANAILANRNGANAGGHFSLPRTGSGARPSCPRFQAFVLSLTRYIRSYQLSPWRGNCRGKRAQGVVFNAWSTQPPNLNEKLTSALLKPI